ncbi:catechol O-methyltransferase B isoform X1 [Eucyclogobius newberryi]|uniref:catechol O-methyltransferase B isoform X1 n=1 Tax=Eucyclogobius newberryi TaxID=166745 RepID=UPI003B59DFB7
MMITCVYFCAGGVGFLYILYRWVIPATVRQALVLMWHDVILEMLMDRITGSTRPQRILRAVKMNAARGNPCSVVKAIDDYCKHKEWAMNVGDEKGCIVDSVVSEVKPTTVLELGTYCAYSTVRIANLLPPNAKFITLEFNTDYAAIAREVINWAGFQDKIQLVEGASGEWIPRLKEEFGVETFDFIFLDHWKDRYLPDTKLLEASIHATSCNAESVTNSPNKCVYIISEMWTSERRHRFAGRQCHLPWNS